MGDGNNHEMVFGWFRVNGVFCVNWDNDGNSVQTSQNENPQGCQSLKRVMQRAKRCRMEANGICSICKQFISYIMNHAKYCKNPKCAVSVQSSVKQWLKQQKVAVTNGRTGSSGSNPRQMPTPYFRITQSAWQQKRAMQQLLQILPMPDSQQQKEQIRQILVNNPPIFEAFMKHMQTTQAQQQQQQLQQQEQNSQ